MLKKQVCLNEVVKSFLKNNFVFLIPIFCSILFFYQLDTKLLWLDEFQTWETIRQPSIIDFIVKLFQRHAHPPLYFLMMWPLNFIFDWNEITLRLPSAISMLIANVVLFNILLKRINIVFAAGCSLLFGTTYYIIYYAQEARPYALFILLALLCFQEFLNVKETPKKFNLWLIFNIFLSLTHYYGIIFFAAQAIILILDSNINKNKKYKLSIIFVATAVISFLYLAISKIELQKLQFLTSFQWNQLREVIDQNILNNVDLDMKVIIFFLTSVALTIILNMFYYVYPKSTFNRLLDLNKNVLLILLSFICFLWIINQFYGAYTARYIRFIIPFLIIVLVSSVYLVSEMFLIGFKEEGVSKVVKLTTQMTIFLLMAHISYKNLQYLVDSDRVGEDYLFAKIAHQLSVSDKTESRQVLIENTIDQEQLYYIKKNKLIVFDWINPYLNVQDKKSHIELDAVAMEGDFFYLKVKKYDFQKYQDAIHIDGYMAQKEIMLRQFEIYRYKKTSP